MSRNPNRPLHYKKGASKASKAKLTEEQVLEVRRVAKLNKYSHRQIGEAVGVTTSAITNIVNRRTWRDI